MENRTMVNAGAPPPPQEVRVRTMHSDLESMAKSGGGMPSFQNVAVSGLAVEEEYTTPSHASGLAYQQPIAAASNPVIQPITPAAMPAPAINSAPATAASVQPGATLSRRHFESPIGPNLGEPHKDRYALFIVATVALLAIGGVGYFAYITFFTGTVTQTTTTVPQDQTPVAVLPSIATTSTSTSTTQITPTSTTTTTSLTGQVSNVPSGGGVLSASQELSVAHNSLFTNAADQIITINLGVTNPGTYRKTVSYSLGGMSPASTLVEINPKASDGKSVAIQGLFAVAGTSALNSQALANFNPDGTFFVYRDRNGFWPGYVLALNAGQSTSSVAASIQQIESSTNLQNIFINNPGVASSDGFTDSVFGGIPVRVLPFTGLTIPSYFVYGWYKNYLVLSTSKNGFVAAIAKL